jgi:anaerobic magnesium-protoporphyrin IX monomethyl ester cyclase
MDKGITVAHVRGAVARLRAAGVRVGFFLQFGYPEEGWRDIEMTRQLIRELAPDEIGISVSYPLPGTRFHERVRAQLGDKRNWRESDDLDPLFPGLFSRDFYRTLSRTVHAEFRTRRALRALRAMARSPLTDGGTALGERLQALGGLTELPVWLAGQARLIPQIRGHKSSKQLP